MPEMKFAWEGTGQHVTCNACSGHGYWYGSPDSLANMYGSAMYSNPPQECPYCEGTKVREIMRRVVVPNV